MQAWDLKKPWGRTIEREDMNLIHDLLPADIADHEDVDMNWQGATPTTNETAAGDCDVENVWEI